MAAAATGLTGAAGETEMVSSRGASGGQVPSAAAPLVTDTVNGLVAEFVAMRKELQSADLASLTNKEKRTAYGRAELLVNRTEWLLLTASPPISEREKITLNEHRDELATITTALQLSFAKRRLSAIGKIIDKADEMLRFLAVWSFLVITSFIVGLPVFLLQPLDTFLVRIGVLTPSNQLGVLARHFIAASIIMLSGVELSTEGTEDANFGEDSAVVCYSHSSTLDAFIISLTIPVHSYSLAKAELFLIPFFSWFLLAFGGLPIDRSNRDQAVDVIKRATQLTTAGDVVVVAPEGTRSKSGQILAFKKGPFYMWETLRTPVIPLVIFGAFELYPPGRQMAISGKVYARFLPAIQPTEVNSREEMLLLVRRRMLEAWMNSPEDASTPISWGHRVKQLMAISAYYYSVYMIYAHFPLDSVLAIFNLTRVQGALYFMAGCVIVTLIIYVYMMHLTGPINRLLDAIRPKLTKRR